MPAGREYKPGFGWPSIALPVVIGAVLLFSFMPNQVLDRLPSLPRRTSASPCVLMVGGTNSQRDALTQAASARNYGVRFAAEAADAFPSLRSKPCGVEMLLIDQSVANYSWLVQQIRNASPNTGVVAVTSKTAPEEISRLVANAGPLAPSKPAGVSAKEKTEKPKAVK